MTSNEIMELSAALKVASEALRNVQSMAVGLGMGVTASECAKTASRLEKRIDQLLWQAEIRLEIQQGAICEED